MANFTSNSGLQKKFRHWWTSSAFLHDKMANPKEKTPMCLVNELARFHSIQPQYKLLNESGPAHSKMFSVQLSLGEQTWESEGSSIKKAQQAVANKALTESTLPKPVQKPPKSNVNNNPGMVLISFLLCIVS